MAVTSASIKWLYLHCHNLEAMRDFYVEQLGMQLGSYRNDEEWAWLTCKCGELELVVTPTKEPLPQQEGWAEQPGWEGGRLANMSFSVEIPEADFAATVIRLKEAAVPAFATKPMWCMDSYWSFPVKDPSGNTVEVYCMLAARPESTQWPE
jgi:hypothetical protein